MDSNGQISIFQSDNILLSDSKYYKYIFKRTEKIVCCVFYIIEHTDKGQSGEAALSVIAAAKGALDAALATLLQRWRLAQSELYTLLAALIALESNLRVAEASAFITGAVADVLVLEIGTVVRSLREYLAAEQSPAPDFASLGGSEALELGYRFAPAVSAGAKREAWHPGASGERADALYRDESGPAPAVHPHAGRAVSIGAHSKGQSNGQHIGRRLAIKDTLSFSKRTTIKDIAKKLPKYSEKSIQREISTMMRHGLVIKEGERRWRKYSLAPGV